MLVGSTNRNLDRVSNNNITARIVHYRELVSALSLGYFFTLFAHTIKWREVCGEARGPSSDLGRRHRVVIVLDNFGEIPCCMYGNDSGEKRETPFRHL
jgi:hypothetical protein